MAKDQRYKSFYTDENTELRIPFELANTRNKFLKGSQLRSCQCSEKHLHIIFGLMKFRCTADRLSLKIHLSMGTVLESIFWT